MGMNTLRNHKRDQRAQRAGGAIPRLRVPRPQRPAAAPRISRNPQAAIYWRRRFVALLIGLAVLALVAWAFSGAVGGAGASAGTAGGSSRPGTASTVSRGSSTGPASSQHHGRIRRPRPCPGGDVVLSASTSQDSYGPEQLPQFNVDVVATAAQTCTFNVGARHVALIVRTGSREVWSSADCVQGAGDLVSDLQRGVPTVLQISWNRQASSPGCPNRSSLVPAGTYSAAVTDGALRSNSVTFRIG